MASIPGKNKKSYIPPLTVSFKASGLLDEVLNKLPDAVIVTDANFIITGLNPAAQAIYGLPPDEAMGKLLFDAIHFNITGSTVLDAITSLLKNGSWQGKVEFHRYNNLVFHFLSQATVIKNEKGQVKAIVLVNQNITESVSDETISSLAEKKYNTLLNALSEGVVMIYADGKIHTANKQAADILGLSSDEITGKVVASPSWKAIRDDGSIFPIDEFPALTTLKTGIELNNVIMGVEKPGGKRVWISINSRPLFEENSFQPYGAVVSFVDITQYREAQEKKNATELLFRSFFHNSPTGCFIYDEDGYVLQSNAEYDKSTFSPSGAAGKHIKELFSTDLAHSILERNKKFLDQDLPLFTTRQMLSPEGEMIYYLLNLTKIRLPYLNKLLIAGQAIDITEQILVSEKFRQSELLFSTFMNNSPALGWIYDDQGNFIYGNAQFLETVGLDETAIGKNIMTLGNFPYVSLLMKEKIEDVLHKNKAQIYEDNLPNKNGVMRYYMAYWFVLTLENGRRLVGGQAVDITERKATQQQVEKLYERYNYAVNASSDAIWDLDLTTQEIYRSDAFSTISGYKKEEIEPTLDWWFNKIHPEDKERVKQKVNHHLNQNSTNWEDEYRFRYADGSYRIINDKGFAIYHDNVPVRLIGAIQDITERKNLEAHLLYEKVQKQKSINQATINALEKERAMISAELHDNVNQLLMSARLHIGVAKKGHENIELLDKASNYLLMAVEEIRALTKKLNNSVVKQAGLQHSILEICANMKTLNNIDTRAQIDPAVSVKLSPEKQLMVFRIVQEQSNNITKYSKASGVMIKLNLENDHCHLLISDNGIGFKVDENKNRGIGLVNIFNRVDAYNGMMDIISSPGNGCTLDIYFPISST